METEKNRENEQTPEEILEVLMRALESGKQARMKVLSLDGETTVTNIDKPVLFEGGCVAVETQEGPVNFIDLERIVSAETAE